jgi:gamma-glutamyl hercynylcysteine S-oxide synthase
MRTRSQLIRAIDEARRTTDCLFGLVRPDSLYDRPIPERHRIIFYIGHVEAFDWNLIARYALDVPAFHPDFDRLFAFGIDPPPGQLPDDTPAAWPGIAEVQRYNLRTREIIDDLLTDVPEQFLHVAIEHRLMHAETLAYILHQLPYEKKRAVAPPPEQACPPTGESYVSIPAGEAKLGLPETEPFGWDNEYQPHSTAVPAFSIGRHKVTNREYLEFVREGGSPSFFWTQQGGRWMYRGMFSEYPLPLDCPVYVTHEQATAFAVWRGLRLPTEPEFHRAAESAAPSRNLDFQGWDPIPVTAEDNGSSGPAQMTGNGWEWTSTTFGPFDGFEPFPFYQNYSEPFFDGRHYVLKGASPRTARCFLRPSFRNWFRPAYPYLYATFRMVKT